MPQSSNPPNTLPRFRLRMRRVAAETTEPKPYQTIAEVTSMKHSPIRVGLIGAGSMGSQHARAYRMLPAMFRDAPAVTLECLADIRRAYC